MRTRLVIAPCAQRATSNRHTSLPNSALVRNRQGSTLAENFGHTLTWGFEFPTLFDGVLIWRVAISTTSCAAMTAPAGGTWVWFDTIGCCCWFMNPWFGVWGEKGCIWPPIFPPPPGPICGVDMPLDPIFEPAPFFPPPPPIFGWGVPGWPGFGVWGAWGVGGSSSIDELVNIIRRFINWASRCLVASLWAANRVLIWLQ